MSELGAQAQGHAGDGAARTAQRRRTFLTRALLAALLAYWATLVALTHLPKPPPVGPRVSDKLAHFLAYGLFTGLVFLCGWGLWPRLKRLPLLVLGFVLAYAAADELTQPLTGRACELRDWLADAGGALVAVTCLAAFRMLYRRLRFGQRGLAEGFPILPPKARSIA